MPSESANGNTIKPVSGKELQSEVTLNSVHWDFWRKALIVLQSMQYEIKTKKVIPFVVNWINTIKRLKVLCKRLLNDGFKYVLLRNFNQDPNKNFFGSIRSHGLLIILLQIIYLGGSKCENDDCDRALDNLKEFIFNDIPIDDTNLVDDEYNSITLKTPVIKKIKRLTKNCNCCIKTTVSDQILKEHIMMIETQMFNLNFDKFVYKCNSKASYNYLISYFIPSNYFTCPEHDLFNIFLKTANNLLIYSYITHINRILT
ncbi:hypothetical protein AGLY_008754 [Aphis glycines]|uniref:DUF4371 domain-containing protein n=1 Tax=Aphis glycines TaxID=307491 RepID=A0A6G0TK27_APHGL|nr:hypothetical protein AGLY_008754 [Aphis glycines]